MEKNMPDENVKAVIDESTENAAYAKPADSSNDEYVGANSPGLYDEEEKPKKSHIGIVVYLLVLICGAIGAIYYVRSTGLELPIADRFFSFETQEALEQDGTEPTSEAAKQVWNMDVDSDINQLVRSYYIALQSTDMEKLNELTDPSVAIDQANVEAAAKYIEGYQNIRCYVAPGNAKNENGLYIAYDIKFKNISTTAPGLVPAYVRRSEDGTPRLIPYENFDSGITTYMTAASAEPEVTSLRSSVTAKYDDALAADPVLAKFVEDLGKGVVSVPDAPTAVVPSGESAAASSSEEDGSVSADVAAAAAAAAAAAQQESSEPSGEGTPSVEGAAANAADGPQVIEGVSFTPATIEKWTFDNLRARSTPNIENNDNVVKTLDPHTKVVVVGVSETWDMIMLENGEGPYFVYNEYLSEDPNHPTTASSR